ncbi:MAG: hypothetical protein ACI4CZ_00520 [Hominisplanchenecus sp.]
MVFYDKKVMDNVFDEMTEDFLELVEKRGFSTAEALEILKIIKLDRIEQELGVIGDNLC